MTWRLRTGIVISAASALLIVWDIIAVSVSGSRATISNLLLTTSYGHPAIPLFLGGLMGHLFWPGKTWGPGVLRVILAACLLAGTIAAGFVAHLLIPPGIPFVFGVVLGRVFVPQNPSPVVSGPTAS